MRTKSSSSAGAPRVRPLSLLVQTTGGAWLIAAFFARLPVAMLPLATIVYGSKLTGSFAVAGLMVAGLSFGGALSAPAVGMLGDRLGHRRTIVLLTAIAAVAIGILASWSWVPEPPVAALVASATLVGASNAQISAMARSSWSARFSGEGDGGNKIEVAMGYETVADEVSFVVGPMVGATLATLVSPLAAMFTALGVLLVAQLSFAGLSSPRNDASGRPGRGPVSPKVAVWVLLSLLVGGVFGSVQTGLTAVLADTAYAGMTGIVYGFMGVGSAVSGMLTHLLRRWPLPRRVVVFGLGLAIMAAGLLGAGNLALLIVACAGLGVCVAPLLVSAFTGAERLAAAGNMLVLTLLSAANIAGVGLGAAVAGFVIDGVGTAEALALPIGIGVVCAVVGVLAHLLRADVSVAR